MKKKSRSLTARFTHLVNFYQVQPQFITKMFPGKDLIYDCLRSLRKSLSIHHHHTLLYCCCHHSYICQINFIWEFQYFEKHKFFYGPNILVIKVNNSVSVEKGISEYLRCTLEQILVLWSKRSELQTYFFYLLIYLKQVL